MFYEGQECFMRVSKERFRSDWNVLQSVTKIHIYLFFKYFFWRISPEPLELQKIFLLLFASLSEELSDEKIVFEVWSQNQLIFAKTLFCQKKVNYWKKSTILKKSKTFLHGIRFRH